MRPVTPFMAIRTVLRVTSFPSYEPCRELRIKFEPYSKRFLCRTKLACERWSGQDRALGELFEGANGGGRWP
ncbi:hypothetical protein RGQ21_49940 [Kitasatospora aureofaciens]|nr:hypothetical protein RGQ21_49940 [Kitasatospora aureofaciens]